MRSDFDALTDPRFYMVLHRIDRELAETVRLKGCPHCGGSLHYATYRRAPRGGPEGLPEHVMWRQGLCCGREGCRRRVLPPSTLFFGRLWHWGAIVLLSSTLAQSLSVPECLSDLSSRLSVAPSTVARWLRYFRQVFPSSLVWQRVRGLVLPSISNDQLPSVLVEVLVQLRGGCGAGLLVVLKLLAYGQAPRSSRVDPFTQSVVVPVQAT